MNITDHRVPKRHYYEAQDCAQDSLPGGFAKDGFIHCTDGEFMVSGIAYNIFRKLKDELLVLFIDMSRVETRIQHDDEEKLFPHIYGPLNRDAIVKIGKRVRDRKGDWISPISEIIPA